MSEALQQQNSWALITGAAQGLGLAFAKICLDKGFHVLLLDINQSLLEQTADELQVATSLQVDTLVADLSDDNFMDGVISNTADKQVGLLINNAALTRPDLFLDVEESFIWAQLKINMFAVVALTRHFGEQMCQRGQGGIINVSSRSGEFPAPFSALYSGAKAFVSKFSETLWWEFKQQGVEVFTLIPDRTDTPSYRKYANADDVLAQSPEDCAQVAFDNLGKLACKIATESGEKQNEMMKQLPLEQLIELIADNYIKMFGVKKE
ncbi:Oxidoreductase UcpA [Sinobacterium norvegicum]|uniref:Oxidoreductase UcpA n=1 Tax=Sinobacterium norvegicum TaxID=1641715 RepID=A0ABN8ELU0_9GAMM|nr:SDR family NAD(P)-dependent oxidoreductase [Sinobacterium norvegicum]CAH0993365.1 Oxidoreductase UcpA [Sinobacterium norvegicum]